MCIHCKQHSNSNNSTNNDIFFLLSFSGNTYFLYDNDDDDDDDVDATIKYAHSMKLNIPSFLVSFYYYYSFVAACFLSLQPSCS